MVKEGARRIRLLLGGAVASVIALLVTQQLITFLEERKTQRRIEVVQQDALVSVRLVGRMSSDVLRERILIDRYVYERDSVDTAAIAREIAELRRDFAVQADRYAALPTLSGEAGGWSQLMTDVITAEIDVRPVLEMSAHHDARAIDRLAALAPAFDRIRSDARALLDVEQRDAEQEVADISRIHRDALRVRLAIGAAIFLIVVIGGARMTSAVVRAQRGVEAANRQLEDRNRELDAFAGRVAHDLRGPLTTLGLAASQLETMPDARRTADALGRGIKRISGLIEDLLALSRIGAKPGACTDTAPVASALADELGPSVRLASGTLKIELAPARIACSQELLRQVLWNLGENALKYRRPEVPPAIAIVGKPEQERYVIHVSDNGVGIPHEDLPRVFEPFYRGVHTSSIPGTGLGLAIVRRVIEVCGGTIAVDSRPGEGTTFSVTLPLAPAEPASGMA